MKIDAEMFEDWLADMSPRLARFQDFVLPKGFPTDFSRSSLATFEQYLLERWPDQAAFLNPPDTDFIDGAVRYVGETFLQAGGGGWRYGDQPGSPVTGRPFIQLDTLDRTAISPYHLMISALKKRTGRELTRIFDAQLANIENRRALEDPGWQPRRDHVPGLTRGTDAEDGAEAAVRGWVAEVPGLLAALRNRLGAAGAGLDLSVGSLSVAVEGVQADLPDEDALDAPQNAAIADQYVAYLGETYRSVAGGSWVLRPGEPGSDNPFLGRPYLRRVDDEDDVATSVPADVLRKIVVERSAAAAIRLLDLYRPMADQ